MTAYRYFAYDMLNFTKKVELPLFGVYMEKALSTPGIFTGSYSLGTDPVADAIFLTARPGQYAIFARRNRKTIWGGPIWSTTYSSQGHTVELSAQTYESVYGRIRMLTDQVYAATEQVTIFNTWHAAVQAQTNCSFGIGLSLPAATGITRNISVLAAENRMASEILDSLSQATNGLDYSVNIVSDQDNDFLSLNMAVLFNNGADPDAPNGSGLNYTYPGAISEYWYTESAAKGAVDWIVTGDGIVASATTPAIATPRPPFSRVISYSDLKDATLLQNKAAEFANRWGMPYTSPAFSVNDADYFEGWDKLGHFVDVAISDRIRFPDQMPKMVTSRLLGWTLQPEQSDQSETLTFLLEM